MSDMETTANGTTPNKLSEVELLKLQLAKAQQELVAVMMERDSLRNEALKQQTEARLQMLSEDVLMARGLNNSDLWKINLQTGDFEPVKE